MKLVFILLAILLIPYLALSGLDRAGLWHSDTLWRGRVSLALMLVFTGSAHFWATEPMSRMLPPWLPGRMTWVYFTGLAEFAAAIGLLIPSLSQLTAWALIVFLVGIFPANVYAAVKRIDVGGQGTGPAYLLIRAPLQLFLIAWTWWFGTR